MRYKNKEKFNRGIMKNIKKKQEKEEIKIINYNLLSGQNDNNAINNKKDSKYNNNNSNNDNNNNQNPNSNQKDINYNTGYSNNQVNNNLRHYSSRKVVTPKESYLKKALENMSKNNLNKSEDSQIFNMEKNDQITDNIIMEKERTSLMSRNYLQRQVSQKKKNSYNKKFSFENKNAEDKNAFGNIKRELFSSKNDKKQPIKLKSDIGNANKNNLINDLQGPTVDFYEKRMDYLSNMYLNVKANPFDYLESEENSTKKKFSKFIPKSANIYKERQENFNVHLIKKFSDFKVSNANSKNMNKRSKTANLKDKNGKIQLLVF